jgi:hypothetical protein
MWACLGPQLGAASLWVEDKEWAGLAVTAGCASAGRGWTASHGTGLHGGTMAVAQHSSDGERSGAQGCPANSGKGGPRWLRRLLL